MGQINKKTEVYNPSPLDEWVHCMDYLDRQTKIMKWRVISGSKISKKEFDEQIKILLRDIKEIAGKSS